MADWSELSKERKALQESGDLPEWFTTHGWQMFKDKFKYKALGYRDTSERIAKQLAQHAPKESFPLWTDPDMTWEQCFFDLLWSGKLAPSSPVLGNTGTDRGQSVSCSGQFTGDSIDEFYSNYRETALLSKEGFGTSAYLGSVRCRGTEFDDGNGTASGALDVVESYVMTASKVSQGAQRRGAWAGYIEVDHGDFFEVCEFLKNNPDDCNIGWLFPDSVIEQLQNGDESAIERWQEVNYVKCMTGKGYIWKPDHAMRNTSQAILNSGVKINQSNLCIEIALPNNDVYTFTCVISSANLAMLDTFTAASIGEMIVFLDCVAQDFIVKGKGVPGMGKGVKFTEDFRALGLGTLGLHTYFLDNGVVFESLEGHMLNRQIYRRLRKESEYASRWLAEVLGEPKWCKGTGMRNATLNAIAPNTTSALIAGGVSQGIEPIYKLVYTQGTAAGEMLRINPWLLRVLAEKGYLKGAKFDEIIDKILHNKGSIQGMDDLFTADEQMLGRTFFEMDQMALARMASARQEFLDQGQSFNLAFSSDEGEEYISEVLQYCLLDERLLGVYYLRMESDIKASKGECLACD